MKKQNPKPKSKPEYIEDAYKLARLGGSVHQICAKIPISLDEAAYIVQSVAQDNIEAGPAHRANLRAMIREKAGVAINIIAKIAMDENEETTVRLRASESLLKHASTFIDESVMRSWHEQQPQVKNGNKPIEMTIFDFGPVISDNGDIAFQGKPRLVTIAENNDLDE